jgi:hypothetical protein
LKKPRFEYRVTAKLQSSPLFTRTQYGDCELATGKLKWQAENAGRLATTFHRHFTLVPCPYLTSYTIVVKYIFWNKIPVYRLEIVLASTTGYSTRVLVCTW